jgi:hypothetical protein
MRTSTVGAKLRNTHIDADRARIIAHREYKRGVRDGRLGFCVSGLSPEYLEGYTLGRKIHHGLVRR